MGAARQALPIISQRPLKWGMRPVALHFRARAPCALTLVETVGRTLVALTSAAGLRHAQAEGRFLGVGRPRGAALLVEELSCGLGVRARVALAFYGSRFVNCHETLCRRDLQEMRLLGRERSGTCTREGGLYV